jgi:hypothetical protein
MIVWHALARFREFESCHTFAESFNLLGKVFESGG